MKKIVVIGSSTGGPSALHVVFSMLPQNFPVPILVAQHLTASFSLSLSRRLNRISNMQVSIITNKQKIESGHAYVIPGDQHFFLTHSTSSGQLPPEYRIHLIPALELPKPSIDMGFTSVAEHFGPGTIGVILSGMGNDGVIGSRAVKQLGGKVIIQDEETSVIFGMAARVQEAGLADEVLPLQKVAGRLTKLVQ